MVERIKYCTFANHWDKLYAGTLKRLFYISILLLGSVMTASAQVANVLPSSTSIANTATARHDMWTSFHNPASLVQTHSWQVAAQYENRSLLAELSTSMVQAAYTNPYVNVGIAYSYFGFSRYSEMMAGLTLARRFGRFSLGLQANFLALYAGDELGYRCTAFPQVGMTIDITELFTLGVQSFNPFVQSIQVSETRRQLPAIYSLGSDYRFYEGIRWLAQVDYDINATFRVATGFEWQAIEQLCIKLGTYYHNYLIGCLGVGLCLQDFCFDLNAELHPVLGVNFLGKLSYQWEDNPSLRISMK